VKKPVPHYQVNRIYHSKFQNKGKEKYHVPLSLFPLKKNKNKKTEKRESYRICFGTWDKIIESMRKEELIKQLQECAPLLANVVSHMVEYIQDRCPSAYPSKEQTEAVNDYLHSVHADGDGSMSEKNCEHRRIASQNITIAAIRILDSRQLDRLQNVLDHIAYDREYYMPERGCGMHR